MRWVFNCIMAHSDLLSSWQIWHATRVLVRWTESLLSSKTRGFLLPFVSQWSIGSANQRPARARADQSGPWSHNGPLPPVTLSLCHKTHENKHHIAIVLLSRSQIKHGPGQGELEGRRNWYYIEVQTWVDQCKILSMQNSRSDISTSQLSLACICWEGKRKIPTEKFLILSETVSPSF